MGYGYESTSYRMCRLVMFFWVIKVDTFPRYRAFHVLRWQTDVPLFRWTFICLWMAVRQNGARFMGKHVGAMLHNPLEMLCVFGALTGRFFNCCKTYGYAWIAFSAAWIRAYGYRWRGMDVFVISMGNELECIDAGAEITQIRQWTT